MGLGCQPSHIARIAWGSLLAFGALVGGCAPRMIQHQTLRHGELVFVVQDGASYQLGDCKRGDTGELTDCRLYEVQFE